MNIKHRWTDLNKDTVTLKIYRSETPIDRANLGTPLATLTQGETEWIDTTAVKGVTYYYVYEAITANDRDVSQNVRVYANYRMGPGPNTFQVGDLNYGYLGELNTSEFISVDALLAALKLTLAPITAARTTLSWHKWARNGKILFVPNQSLVQNVSWTQLYNLGLVYGTGDGGKGNFLPNPTVPQNARVKIGPDTFVVRLMTGYSDNLADIPEKIQAAADPDDNLRCEWEDLIYPLFKYVPIKQRMVNVANLSRSQLSLGRMFCQEQCSAVDVIIRGDATTSESRFNVAYRSNFGASGSASSYMWYPVLELVNG